MSGGLSLGTHLPVARVINQAHCVATGGSFDNGLPFSLSMGCGTWGGNNFSDNLTYRHYLNITVLRGSFQSGFQGKRLSLHPSLPEPVDDFLTFTKVLAHHVADDATAPVRIALREPGGQAR
jgi:hypothetical protein